MSTPISTASRIKLLVCLVGPMAMAGSLAACTAAEDNQLSDGADQGDGTQGTGQSGVGGFEPGQSDEQCNGYDDDGDGRVDEGCPCELGQEQPCYTGPPATDGIGICRPGSQQCTADPSSGEFDSYTWGPCEGSVLPADEICESGIDEDCNGVDDPCGSGGSGPGDGGSGAGGSGPGGGGPGGSGTGGSGTGGTDPGVLEVDILFFGDCVTAYCPPSHPHPIGCQVFFTPGDDRGCVANQLGASPVYFQAGDQCDEGFVTGKLLCSDSWPTEPLSASNCPINKPIPIYGELPSDCPETH